MIKILTKLSAFFIFWHYEEIIYFSLTICICFFSWAQKINGQLPTGIQKHSDMYTILNILSYFCNCEKQLLQYFLVYANLYTRLLSSSDLYNCSSSVTYETKGCTYTWLYTVNLEMQTIHWLYLVYDCIERSFWRENMF